MGVGRFRTTWKSAVTVHGGSVLSLLLHEVDRRGPVAVAVEQGATDAAVEDAFERHVMRLRLPVADEFRAHLETPNP